MAKFMSFTEISEKDYDEEGFSSCPYQDGDLVIWDGKTFRRQDGSKFSVEIDTHDMPECYIVGWVQTLEIGKKQISRFAALDLPENKSNFEERQRQLDVMWRASTNSSMYVVAPDNIHKSPPLLAFRSSSLWSQKGWAFVVK